MTRLYGIIPQYTKYIVCMIDRDGRKFYAANYYNGEYTWTRDYLYAREYSKRTAQQHVVRLIDREIDSAYYAPLMHI